MCSTGAAAMPAKLAPPNNLFLLPPWQKKNKQKLNKGNNEMMPFFFFLQSVTPKPSGGGDHSLGRFLAMELQVVCILLDTTSLSLSCLGEGNGNPLQCSCLENPRDGGAWWLPSMGSHRVGHDWSDLAAAAAAAHILARPWLDKSWFQFCLCFGPRDPRRLQLLLVDFC